MAIKYECFYCKNIYQANEVIDGYNQGYTVGFLCPRCGMNIKAGLLAKQKTSLEQYVWTFISFVLLLPTMLTMDSDLVFEMLGRDININMLLFILWVAFMAILFILKPALFKVTTFLTEPVSKS